MMTYTEEVRKKLDAILKAFESYIDGQNYFDIVYGCLDSYLKDYQERYSGGGES